MKLSAYIIIVLTIGLCFAVVGSIITDMNTYYPESNVNISWADKYDYQEEVAGNSTLLQTMLNKLGDEDTGYLLTALIGIAAIPVAFITAIGILFTTMGIGISILSEVASEVGIPPFVIPYAVTALTISIVWGILAWWRRYRD